MPLNSSWRLRPGYTTSGWTVFTQAPGSKIVYVAQPSNSGGSDSQCGYAPALTSGVCPGESHSPGHSGPHGPKLSFNAGRNATTNNSSDWVLFRCGDTWSTATDPNWSGLEQNLFRTGVSSATPWVMSSYETATSGSARPRFIFSQTPGQAGFQIGSRVAIAHISVETPAPYVLNTTGAIQVLNNSVDSLIEGCYVSGRDVGINFANCGGVARRNVVYYCHSSGILVENPEGVRVEENFIYRMGEYADSIGSGIASHGVYITNENDGTGAIVRDNLISDIKYSALDLRCDNITAEGNVVVRAYACIDVGAALGAATVTTVLQKNLILDGRYPFGTPSAPAYGIRVCQGQSHQILDNIIANTEGVNAGFGIHLLNGSIYPLTGTSVARNIVWNWGGSPLGLFPNTASIVLTSLESNDFQDSKQAVAIAQSFSNDSVTALMFTLSRGNRYWNSLLTPPTSGAFVTTSGNKTLTQWNTLIGDSSPASTSTQVSYPVGGPATASITEYAKYISSGLITNHDDFMRHVRDSYSKATWKPLLTAKAINTWMRGKFGL